MNVNVPKVGSMNLCRAIGVYRIWSELMVDAYGEGKYNEANRLKMLRELLLKELRHFRSITECKLEKETITALFIHEEIGTRRYLLRLESLLQRLWDEKYLPERESPETWAGIFSP